MEVRRRCKGLPCTRRCRLRTDRIAGCLRIDEIAENILRGPPRRLDKAIVNVDIRHGRHTAYGREGDILI